MSWQELARLAFPDGKFSKQECIARWSTLSRPKPLRGPWTKDEDTKLEGLVAKYGSEKWVVIANEMATRSGKQWCVPRSLVSLQAFPLSDPRAPSSALAESGGTTTSTQRVSSPFLPPASLS